MVNKSTIHSTHILATVTKSQNIIKNMVTTYMPWLRKDTNMFFFLFFNWNLKTACISFFIFLLFFKWRCCSNRNQYYYTKRECRCQSNCQYLFCKGYKVSVSIFVFILNQILIGFISFVSLYKCNGDPMSFSSGENLISIVWSL